MSFLLLSILALAFAYHGHMVLAGLDDFQDYLDPQCTRTSEVVSIFPPWNIGDQKCSFTNVIIPVAQLELVTFNSTTCTFNYQWAQWIGGPTLPSVTGCGTFASASSSASYWGTITQQGGGSNGNNMCLTRTQLCPPDVDYHDCYTNYVLYNFIPYVTFPNNTDISCLDINSNRISSSGGSNLTISNGADEGINNHGLNIFILFSLSTIFIIVGLLY